MCMEIVVQKCVVKVGITFTSKRLLTTAIAVSMGALLSVGV